MQVPHCRKRLASIVAVAYRAAICSKDVAREWDEVESDFSFPTISPSFLTYPLGGNFFLSPGVASFTQIHTCALEKLVRFFTDFLRTT